MSEGTGGVRRREADTELKTKTPHVNVGNYQQRFEMDCSFGEFAWLHYYIPGSWSNTIPALKTCARWPLIAEAPACSSQDCQHEPNTNNPKDNPQPRDNLVQDRSDSTEDNPDKSCTKPHKPAVTFKPSSPSQSLKDRKKAFQHVAKNTKKGVVDVDSSKEQLVTIYGNKGEGIVHAAVGYKPKKERIP